MLTGFLAVVPSFIRCRLEVVEGFNRIGIMSTLSCCESIVIKLFIEGLVGVIAKNYVMTCEDDSFLIDFISGLFLSI